MLNLDTLVFLHSAFMLSAVKMRLKGENGGVTLNRHGNYIVDHHGIVFLNFCGNPVRRISHKLYVEERSGSAVESRGCMYEPHRRHCFVSLRKTLYPWLITGLLLQPRKIYPHMTVKLFVGDVKNQKKNKIKLW